MNEKYLIETDFLFGLRSSDKLHPRILAFISELDQSRKKIFLSGASIVEVPLVLLGEGKSNSIVQQTISVMKTALYGLTKYSVQNFQFNEMLTAFSLREKYNTTFFDSIHLATALNNDLVLVSSDKDMINVITQENGNGIII